MGTIHPVLNYFDVSNHATFVAAWFITQIKYFIDIYLHGNSILSSNLPLIRAMEIYKPMKNAPCTFLVLLLMSTQFIEFIK